MQSDFTIFLEVQLTDLRKCIAAKHQECLKSLESELTFLRSEQHILPASQDLGRFRQALHVDNNVVEDEVCENGPRTAVDNTNHDLEIFGLVSQELRGRALTPTEQGALAPVQKVLSGSSHGSQELRKKARSPSPRSPSPRSAAGRVSPKPVPVPSPHPHPSAPEGSPHALHSPPALHSPMHPARVQNSKAHSRRQPHTDLDGHMSHRDNHHQVKNAIADESRGAWVNNLQRCQVESLEHHTHSRDHDHHNNHHHGHQPHHQGQSIESRMNEMAEDQQNPHNELHTDMCVIESRLAYLSSMMEKFMHHLMHRIHDAPHHTSTAWNSSFTEIGWGASSRRGSVHHRGSTSGHHRGSTGLIRDSIVSCGSIRDSTMSVGEFDQPVRGPAVQKATSIKAVQKAASINGTRPGFNNDGQSHHNKKDSFCAVLPHDLQAEKKQTRFSINSVQSRGSMNWCHMSSGTDGEAVLSQPAIVTTLSNMGNSFGNNSIRPKDPVTHRVQELEPHEESLRACEEPAEEEPIIKTQSRLQVDPSPSPRPSGIPALRISSTPDARRNSNLQGLRISQMPPDAIRVSAVDGRMSNMPSVALGSANVMEFSPQYGRPTDFDGRTFQLWPIWHHLDGDCSEIDPANSEPLGENLSEDDDESSDSDGSNDSFMVGSNPVKRGSMIAGEIVHVKDRLKECLCCRHGLRGLMVQPSHPLRMIWDPVGFLIICYEFVMVPLDFFALPEERFFVIMQWFMRIYWSCDCPFSFITGFQRLDGKIEMRPSVVVKNYVCTWFPFDITILAFDWAELFFGFDGMGTARIGKTLKTLRLLRMVRLVRLVKLRRLPDFVRAAAYKFHSERFLILVGIARIMIVLIGIAHLIACIWYAVGVSGNMEDNMEDNWLFQSGVMRSPFGLRYTTSMHWSLSQFTGTSDVIPVSFGERSFAVFVMLLGFLVSASVVSSITSSMTRLQIVTARQSTQVSMLRQYLFDNGISSKVALRVQRNAMFSLEQEKKNTPESSIELLNLVSEPLRVELHYEIYSPTLCWHPFLKHYKQEHEAALRRVCHRAVTKLFLARGDILFTSGEVPHIPTMYFIVSGKFCYTPVDSKSSRHRKQILQANQWAVELVLWTPWVHVGTMAAKSECCVMLLNALEFQAISTQYRGAKAKLYAEEFINRLNEIDNGYLSDTDRLPIDPEDLCAEIFKTKEPFPRHWSMTRSNGGQTLSPWDVLRRRSSAASEHSGEKKGFFAEKRSRTMKVLGF